MEHRAPREGSRGSGRSQGPWGDSGMQYPQGRLQEVPPGLSLGQGLPSDTEPRGFGAGAVVPWWLCWRSLDNGFRDSCRSVWDCTELPECCSEGLGAEITPHLPTSDTAVQVAFGNLGTRKWAVVNTSRGSSSSLSASPAVGTSVGFLQAWLQETGTIFCLEIP